MNIRDLNYFCTLAKYQHFSKAAERCFVSQPTLSNQIQKMEQYLGVRLFERSNKKVLPTAVGLQLLECAERALQEVAQMKRIAAQSINPLHQTLHLGAFPTLAPYLFPKLVTAINQQLPNITLLLIEEKTEQLIHLLKNGKLDCALLALPINDKSLDITSLFTEPLLVATSSANRLAQNTTITESQLAKQPLMLLDEGHCLRSQALAICKHLKVSNENYRATSLETLRQMAIADTGVTIIPKIAATHERGINYIPFSEPQPTRTIGLATRKTMHAQELFDILKSIIPKLVLNSGFKNSANADTAQRQNS